MEFKNIYLSEEFFKNTSIAIMVLNHNKEIITMNTASVALTGYTVKSVKGKKIDVFHSEQDTEDFYKDMWEKVENENLWEGEVWLRHKNGNLYLVKRSVFKIEENNQNLYVYLSRDITDSKNKELQMEDMLYKDVLTNFPNKHVFKELSERILQQSKLKNRKAAIIFCDLFRFNRINKSFGYLVGDLLIKEAGERIKSKIGEDAVITRLGGDLFAFILPDIKHEKDIIRILELTLNEFKGNPFLISGSEVFISINMGVSIFPVDGDNVEELMRNADLAKSRAKENGTDSYQFYTAELNVKVLENLMMETNLIRAIENEEFVLFYQPQIDIEKNEIVSVEALIRWQHPEFGLIPPGRFIPLAEETGLINKIDQWVFKETIRQTKEWQNKGFKSIVAGFNLSPQQLESKNFIQNVKATLAAEGLETKYVELEVTEGALMKNSEQTINTLKELKNIGVRIAIDDFGTGYSSLGYLAQFPLDILKIDRSFIKNVEHSERDRKITSIIIHMAHELGLEVIAEGVENEKQLEFLEQEKCEKYQGYLYSPPISVSDIEKLLTKKK